MQKSYYVIETEVVDDSVRYYANGKLQKIVYSTDQEINDAALKSLVEYLDALMQLPEYRSGQKEI